MAPKRRICIRQTEEEGEEQEVTSASSADSERTASESETDRSEDDDSVDNDFELHCRSGKDAEESEEETRRATAAKPRKRKQPETVKKPTKATKKQKKAEMTPIKYWVLSNDEKEQEYKKAGSEGDFEGDILYVENFFFEGLWQIFYKKMVFIPVHHAKHHHYSLIMIDNEKRYIFHLNSMMAKKKESNNHFSTKNAATVVDKIREFIRHVAFTKVLPNSEDPEEYRDKGVRMSQGEMVEEKVLMSEEEKETRNYILNNGIGEDSYRFIKETKVPQQDSMLVDCGPYVYYFMEEIAMGMKLTKDGAQNMRKKMLERFMQLTIEPVAGN